MAVKEGVAALLRVRVRAIARANTETVIRATTLLSERKKFQNDFFVIVECLNDNITNVDAF